MELKNPIFNDEDAAREYLEASRWPDGAACPSCGLTETVSAMPPKGSMGKGWYHCRQCRQKFTVRVGTLYERSHVPLYKWLLATHLFCSSKKGMSAHQLHRMLGVTYKTAWFMAHRIREGMTDANPGPMGGEGQIVEADETYYGNTSKRAKSYKKGHRNKEQIVALVEPGKKARAFHVKKAKLENVREILVTNIDRKSALHTDESGLYTNVGREFGDHKTVCHGNPYPINKMATMDLLLSVGVDVFVLGYPFGIGPGGLPIWKRGSIATEPEIIDQDRPVILIDSASRPGMSGSPVIRRSWNTHSMTSGGTVIHLARLVFAMTHRQLAQEFGRDRSTIHHACGLIEEMREDSAEFDSTLRWMESLLRRAAGQKDQP